MFSGGDSSDGINSLNQLGAYGFVNQAAVSNAMAAGQNIDWAQLAQQWIQMRDNSAVEHKTNPSESANKVREPSSHSSKFEEKGEADMDMDDEEQTIEDKTTQRLSNTSAVHNSLNQPWLFNEGTPRTATYSQWNPWSNREVLPQSLPNQTVRPTNPTAHIPSLLNITVPNPNEIRVMPDISKQPENTTNMMDAAKRKGLPAWIREGLEKMEREKQKQLEKEQQNKDNINSSDEDNASGKHILAKPLKSANDDALAILDEDSTDNEDVPITMGANYERSVNLQRDNEERDGDNTYSSSVGKTYEQKLADLMIVVRRTLTELLLEATNEEISKVAGETIKTFKSKASSAQVIRKSALSTLTGKLGLAAYGDSSSEDNSDDDDEHNSSKKATGQSESDNDSEEETRNVIRQKRRAFIKTSEEIEERVALAAAREEEKLKIFLRLEEEEEERERNRKKQQSSLLRDPSSSGHSGHNIYKGYEKDFGEITETKIQHINGKRQRDRSSRKERTTRFSDNKDKYVALPNAATFLTSMNTAVAANSGNSNSTAASLSGNSQRQAIPDINGLLPNYANAGVTNVLNAADAALEKVLKGKATSVSPEKQSRRHYRDYAPAKKRQRTSESKDSRSRSKSSSSSTSSSSSSTSSDSDSSSTSRSSLHSKYSHRTATKQKSHSSADRQYEKSHKDHHYRNDRKYASSSSSYRKRGRESSKGRYLRNGSSDSEDEHRRRHKYNSHYKRNSSHSRSYTSSRRDRDREHSRSQSRSSYSSSSNRRQ